MPSGDLPLLRQVRMRGQPNDGIDCIEHGLALVRGPRLESLELADQEAPEEESCS